MMHFNISIPRLKIYLLIACCWVFCGVFYTREPFNDTSKKEKVLVSDTVPPCRRQTFDRNDIAVYIQKKLEMSLKLDKGQGCNIPHLDPFSKDAIEDEDDLPQIVCGPQDWVKCSLSKCRMQEEVLKTVSGVRCKFRDIIYVNDFSYELGPIVYVTKYKDSVYELRKSDHVNVICHGTNITSGNITFWSANILGFRPVSLSPAPKGRERTPDVMIFLFDSASKTGFIRLMPKTWKVLNEVLGATVMHGFNIVGDGTPFALFPLLTGKTELELPDVRRIGQQRRYLDDFPFIFYKVKKDGYRTAYLEDMPIDGTFQYRFQGFTRQPTDHYLRAFKEASKPLYKEKKWNYCLGDTPQYKVMMNITEQFLNLDGKHFIVTFIADITHESLYLIQYADEEMAAFLTRLAKRADNTLIIVMGDHGPRYRKKRVSKISIRSKLDERLPLLTIRLPEPVRSIPGSQQALEANSRVLTTVHDLHATILDVLDLRQYWNPYKVTGADLYRGLTMLETIPRNRSCSEAGIETHWCSCLVWVEVAATNRLYNKSANALVDYINWLLRDTGPQCVPRTLATIHSVSRQRANSDLLSYSGAIHYDSYLGRFNYNTNMVTENYNVAIVADPGSATYEASMVYFVKEDIFVVFAEDISRTNAYNDEPACMVHTHPHLAPYCYCRS